MRNLVLAFALALTFLANAVFAQSDYSEMMTQWDETAERAVVAVDSKLASTPALESLRGELVDDRTQAQVLEAESKEYVAPLISQLEALGPPPEDGQYETFDLTNRRADLTAKVVAASAPVLVAQEAYQRSNLLIGKIDAIIRSRFSEALMELGPTPINPALWPSTLYELKTYGRRIIEEVTEAFALQSSRDALKLKAPLALLFIGIGLWFLLGLRRGFANLVTRVLAFDSDVGLWQTSLVNLSRLVVLGAGAAALIFAIESSDLVGVWGGAIVDQLPLVSFVLIASAWIGRSIFGSPKHNGKNMFGSRPGLMGGQGLSIGLGVVYSASLLLASISEQARFSLETQAILNFPLVMLASFLLFRLSIVMRGKKDRNVKADTADDVTPEYKPSTFIGLLSRIVLVVSLAAPVLAAIGYFAAAQFLVYPTIATLGFLAALLVLFDLTQALLDLWIEDKNSHTRRDQVRLIPVIVGILLLLAAMPVLALIWGARTTDLLEIWAWMNEGVAIGESRFSLSDLIVFIVVFGAGYTLTRLMQKTVRKSVFPRTKLDTGGKSAIMAGIGYTGISLAGLAAISATGLDLSSLAIIAGALSLGIGFGLQTIVSNFVSGIILLVERPIKEGDWITAGGFEGIVRKISVRATLVDTFDRCAVIIPNSELIAGSVTNWTSPDLTGRLRVAVGVAYGTDPEKVKEILLGIAGAHAGVMKYPVARVMFMTFGASSLDFELRCFLKDINNVTTIRSDINFEIYKQFAAEGIEIPFEQRDINIKNISDLGAAISGELNKDKADK